ncbi:multifunctional acyl-CoA thioesterase I/protease I/lysophospholipase L1 [Photobacterium sp. 1_MG-2023]|uniref:multifunctional acyl-CoA thioesterase I/protease I/lysophospholipase L1 n=1 Tax=Photobacterium sp. 1_MG-2023 TaxID=3062646 RepID=UPI0026E3DF34|nr:multifunctional acyl-CoA thioesterase I/protease I/lysophospholipase L1 [Photobacterium sp. 1_MG-2023]MDO6705294.1 multifunctional acyl-CoA thioesterase I/protease I/lysophospholipase L1 [Photobacterium sp. 1_MG-2023]
MMRILALLLLVMTPVSSFAATLMVFGDSLSAGYQMRAEQSWPRLMEPMLNSDGLKLKVVNASISGDTTGNGLARLPKLLKQHSPDYVIIELGANDGLRGFPPATVEKNLTAIIDLIYNSGAEPMLMQIRIPPNYGKRYTSQFEAIYPKLSASFELPLLPFFLEEVILQDEWMMEDGLHPTAEAQPWIAQFMTEAITPFL